MIVLDVYCLVVFCVMVVQMNRKTYKNNIEKQKQTAYSA